MHLITLFHPPPSGSVKKNNGSEMLSSTIDYIIKEIFCWCSPHEKEFRPEEEMADLLQQGDMAVNSLDCQEEGGGDTWQLVNSRYI